MDLELAQRPVVVEHDRPRTGAREPPREPLLDRRVDGRRPPAPALAAGVPAETSEEPLGPAPAVEILDPLRHRLEAPLPLSRRQLERGGEVLDDSVHVPRVDEERAREDLSGAGELGQQERTTPAARQPRLGLTEHELLRDEVHPVAQRGHHHHVRAPIEGDEALLRDVPMDVLDGRHAGTSVAAVDPGDEELDLVALRPVVGAVEPRRHDDLDHRRRPRSLRILLEEPLESVELLRDALRVVEPLHPEHQPPSLVLTLEVGE